MESIYSSFDQELQAKLEAKSFYVTTWLVSEAAERYQLSIEEVENLARQFHLPIVGEGKNKLILMYKPNVCLHPHTHKKALIINLFEIVSLNKVLRQRFLGDYQTKTWFWHRFVWRLPTGVLNILERSYLIFASFFYSPKDSFNIFRLKLQTYYAKKKVDFSKIDTTKVGQCFTKSQVSELATQMREHYSSCLWMRGDILLVDNKKVMHAGMPGAGTRLVRALIGNPLEMSYSASSSGLIDGEERQTQTLGYYANKPHITQRPRVVAQE